MWSALKRLSRRWEARQNVSSAASQLAKHGAAARAETLAQKQERVHAELRAYVKASAALRAELAR